MRIKNIGRESEVGQHYNMDKRLRYLPSEMRNSFDLGLDGHTLDYGDHITVTFLR